MKRSITCPRDLTPSLTNQESFTTGKLSFCLIATCYLLPCNCLATLIVVESQAAQVIAYPGAHDYHRKEVLQMADSLKSSPMRFTITNGITMDVEITKSDLRTIVGKSTKSNMFNAIKNALARDIPGYLSKAE